ncbi:hypothetical protein K470DRAFT_264475 [Piedraia hortae CBS 480.64]|uniref:C2H2-type domain-containing protein n=1 Tax=Piedraia hortae CBS 480.64 TaxID=1314780 RepID=A0A6A7BZ22_9PEZI|nr:hypothetical protein K470DRAFT_264475 [Piedraia hortae CBS 480.64]
MSTICKVCGRRCTSRKDLEFHQVIVHAGEANAASESPTKGTHDDNSGKGKDKGTGEKGTTTSMVSVAEHNDPRKKEGTVEDKVNENVCSKSSLPEGSAESAVSATDFDDPRLETQLEFQAALRQHRQWVSHMLNTDGIQDRDDIMEESLHHQGGLWLEEELMSDGPQPVLHNET